MSMFSSHHHHENPSNSHSQDAQDDSKMVISTPTSELKDQVEFGDLETPKAEPMSHAHSQPTRPIVSSDKRLQNWRIGPRYVATGVIGRGSYGEVASGFDTLT